MLFKVLHFTHLLPKNLAWKIFLNNVQSITKSDAAKIDPTAYCNISPKMLPFTADLSHLLSDN